MRSELPADEGDVVDRALHAHLDALRSERTDTEPLPDLADALVRMATVSMGVDPTVSRPSPGRVLVHVDVDAPTGPHGVRHLGPALPAELRRLATCDATYQVVYERDARPVGVGRTRTIPSMLRALVEQRDDGCRVPGCLRLRGLHLHHVEHWEDGGLSETHNLVALCPRHHRQHHLGTLEIDGVDADRADGITFRRGGRILRHRPPPTPVAEERPPAPGARAYAHPTGESLHEWSLTTRARPPDSG